MQYSCWKDRIENLSDEKTRRDAEPSDLVREASVSVTASLCIVGTIPNIIIIITIIITIINGIIIITMSMPHCASWLPCQHSNPHPRSNSPPF